MLGRIELKQPVQGIPLASTVLSRCPLCWSEDNNIVLATQLGACIYELHMSPHGNQAGLSLERVYLPPPDTPNQHILAGNRLQKMVVSLQRDESQRIMLDATLTTVHRAAIELPNRRSHPAGAVPCPGEDGNLLGYTKAIWAPRGTAEGDGCLLCMVTFDHKLHLVSQRGVNWKVVYDLSSRWHKFSIEEGKKIVDQYQASIGFESHHKFIAKTRFLGVADVMWTSLFKSSAGEAFCILFLATTSSHVALLKIPALNMEQFEPSVLDCFALDDTIGKISALHWLSLYEREGVLSIGTVKGHVEIHCLAIKENDVIITRLYTFENSLKGMLVNHLAMACVNMDKNIYVLFIGKHNILISHLLHLNGSSVELLASAHCYIGCFAISGLKVVDPNLLYVSAKDGKLFKLDVEYDLKSYSTSFRSKKTLFSSDGLLYNGFCFSPNYSFMAILECVSVPYDHLLMKEPTLLNLLQVNTFETLFQHVLKNDSSTLSNQVDIFESLRLMTCRKDDEAVKSLNIKEIASLSPHQKRVYLWITFIELGSLSRDDQSSAKEKKEKLINALEESILVDHISEVLSSFSSKSKESFPCNALHQHSLYQMCIFLQRVKRTHSMIKIIKSYLKKENMKGEERCLVCQSPVEFTSVKVAKCSEGHSLPRCMKSLVPTLPVMRCVHCDLFYHPEVSEWYGENSTRCLICSRKLLYRVRGRKSFQDTNQPQ